MLGETLRISLDGQHLIIVGGAPKGKDAVHKTISSWPGWRRMPHGPAHASLYRGRANMHTYIRLLNVKAKVVWTGETKQEATSALERFEKIRAILAEPGALLPMGWPTARIPKWHQFVAVKATDLLGHRYLLNDQMGLGKTSTALWAADSAGSRRLLILCPVTIKYNWYREIRATLGEGWRIFVLDGNSKKRADVFADWSATIEQFSQDRIAFIMNYDLLRFITEEQLAQVSQFPDYVILDESHYIKDVNAERTRLATKVVGNCKHVALLTGTPIRSYANDLYAQVNVIQPETWYSHNEFLNRYIVLRQVTHGKKKRWIPVASKNEKELSGIMSTIQIQRKKKDVIGLPPKIHTYPELTFDEKMAQIYREMSDWAKYELEAIIKETSEEEQIWSPRVMTGATAAFMRCEQIASGFVGGLSADLITRLAPHLKYAEKIQGRPNELIFPQSAKIVWLRETVDTISIEGGRPVIFSRFNAPLLWLKEKVYQDRAVVMHGKMTPKQKDQAVEDFQKGSVPIMLCQVQMAVGFNLTASHDVIFFSRDWSPATNEQAEDRCHRMGQKGTVQIQIPIVRGTVEVYLQRKLQAKASSAESALANVTLGELIANL